MPNHDVSPDDLSGPVVDRRTTMKLLGAAGMAGLAGCAGGDGDDDDVDPEDVEEGGRLQAGWFTGEIGDLHPGMINVGQYFQIASNIFNGLVALEEDLTFRGDLAEDWEVEEDGSRYVFELRDDVVFHNGDEFTAEDVEFTVRHNIENEVSQASRLATLEPVDEGGVEVIDDYTVALNWEEPTASALAHFSRGPGRAVNIINQTAIEEMGAQEYSIEPVGTGPFQVAEHNVGSELVLDAFDDYFETDEEGNQLPYLDGIDIQMIPEPGTMVNALRGGDIHFANQVPEENVSVVEGDPNIEISSVIGNTWLALGMNTDREPLGDVQIRRGIAKAIDSERIAEDAFYGYAEPASGVFAPKPDWIDRDDKPDDQAYDPEEAEQLLEEAGAFDHEFAILNTAEDERTARNVIDHLESVGLDVSLDLVTDSTYWDRFQGGDYDMTVSGSVDKPDPEESVWNFYRLRDEDGVWNWTNYENETVHELLGEQRRTVDTEERAEILWEIEDTLIEEAPHAYLVHNEDLAAYRDSVHGFTHIPSFLRDFHTVWLSE